MTLDDSASAAADSNPIRAAVVGTGAIGRIHAAAMTELDGFEVVSLVGGHNADALASEVAAAGGDLPSVHARLDDALEDPSVDLVVIATPSGLHGTQAL